jgi:sugar O-acyltransferase (sialic acid O-acetyltransferase NeuD family)
MLVGYGTARRARRDEKGVRAEMSKLLLIGGGGHCKSVLDSLLETKQFAAIGIVDVRNNIGTQIMGTPIVGCDDDLRQLFVNGYRYAFVTVGSIGNPQLRINLFHLIEEIGYEIPNIIDPSATVSRHAELSTGIFVGKQAVVNAGAAIHRGAIINTGAVVEHDCVVGEFAHISPGAVLCGQVNIGRHTHIGANSVIKQQLNIGEDVMIGMGSVVLRDVAARTTAYGNPCKE